MKIGINLVDLIPGKIGGMEQYIRNFIWYAIHDTTKEHKVYLFLSSDNIESFNNFETESLYKILINKDKKEIQLYEYIDKFQLDLWFCPLLILEPKYVSIPSVVTIPDIQHEFYPDYFDKQILEWRKNNFAFTVNKASHIFTISKFSKETIIEKFNIEQDKISYTYLDADKEFNNYNDDKQLNINVKEKYNLPEQYFFYPANTWPHKNHLNLLKAFKIYREKYSKDFKLVLTGSEDKAHKKIKEFININNLKEDVLFLGYIQQEDMPYIYRNANCLVFPSLFEGFGIPLVEAMKTNCPIICSDCGSIPEIIGECALIFDPLNPENIVEKMHKITIDLNIREELINKGKIRAGKFSWEKCYQDTFDIFDKLYLVQEINKKEPLVSIITPSFNQGQFIKETIDSVLNQNYPSIEYIVVDGGSTDNTVEILKSYGDKLKWVSEKDEGQADAVNKGLNMAKGKIIGWLNSDDTYLPGAIRKAVDFLMCHKEIGMVYGEGYHVDINGNIIDRYPTETFDYKRLAETCFICQPTGFFKKEVFENAGILDKELHLCMDYELWMRIGKFYEIAYIPQYLATSRMYEENKTLSRRKEVYLEIIRTVKKYYNYVPISWIYGYADYLLNGQKGIKFITICLLLFFKYNINNLAYASRVSFGLLKMKMKQKYKPDIFTERYEDGWVSKIYGFNIEKKPESRKIILKGRHLWPYEESLQIKVKINGHSICTKKVKEKGQFILEVDTSKFKDLLNVQLLANKTFCPQKMGINNDTRLLSYIIDSIDLSK